MSGKEVIIDTIRGFDIEQNGETLTFKGAAYYDDSALFTDTDSLKLVGTRARHTANGLYDLIINNCDTENIDLSKNAHLEIYLTLAGLACEIYLKSLIYFDRNNNGAKIIEHKIENLFSKISSADQAEIRASIPDIDSVMPELSDLFPKIRYDFELLHIKGEYLNVFNLMKLLHKICNAKDTADYSAIRSGNGTLCLQ